MAVLIMTDDANDDVCRCCRSNGDFVAVFVGLVVFTFANTINCRLMQRVDLVFIFGLLIQNPLVKQKVFLILFKQSVFGQRSP